MIRSASILVEKIQGAATSGRKKPGWKLADSLEQHAKLKKRKEKKKRGGGERRGEAKIERVLRWECLMAARCCSLGEVCRPPLSFLSGPPIQHSVCDSQWPAKCASRRSPPLFLVPTLVPVLLFILVFRAGQSRPPLGDRRDILKERKKKKEKRRNGKKRREKKRRDWKEGGKR